MYRNFPKYALAAALVAAAASCAPQKPSDNMEPGELDSAQSAGASAVAEQEPVLVVDGEQITLGEFNRRIRALPEFASSKYATVDQKQAYLESITQFEVMADVAEREGFGDHPTVRYALEEVLADRLLADEVRKRVASEDIDEAAVRRYYEAHLDAYRTPAARRVALIEAATREAAERTRQRVLADIQTSEDEPVLAFRKSAAAYTLDRAVAKKGGDIGFVQSPEAEDERPKVARAVWALDRSGQVSPVFAIDSGWALATFFEEREASVAALEAVSGEIRQRLHDRLRAESEREFLAELRAAATVDKFEEVAQKARAPQDKADERGAGWSLDDIPTHPVDPFDDAKTARTPQQARPDKRPTTSDGQ